MIYIQRTALRKAIQFKDNRDEIIQALGIDKKDTKLWTDQDSGDGHLFINAPSTNLGSVYTGEWIVWWVDAIAVMTDSDFHAQYKPLKEVKADDQAT